MYIFPNGRSRINFKNNNTVFILKFIFHLTSFDVTYIIIKGQVVNNKIRINITNISQIPINKYIQINNTHTYVLNSNTIV